MAKLYSKRGYYSKSEIEVEEKDGNFVILKKKKNPKLAKIDKKRNTLNKHIKEIKDYYADFLAKPVDWVQQANFDRYFNMQVYGTKPAQHTEEYKRKRIKELEEKINIYRKEPKKYENEIEKLLRERYLLLTEDKPRKPTFYSVIKRNGKLKVRNDKLIEKARELYAQRKKLDEESRKLRKGEKNYYKSMYDAIRNSYLRAEEEEEKKQIKQGKIPKKQASYKFYIYANGKEIALYGNPSNFTGDITPLHDKEGKVIGYQLSKELAEKLKLQKMKKKKITISTVAEREIAEAKVKRVSIGRIQEIPIYSFPNGTVYTTADLTRMFNYAYKRHHQEIIFINGLPFTKSDFIYDKKNKIWVFKTIPPFPIERGFANFSYTKPSIEQVSELVYVTQKQAKQAQKIYLEINVDIRLAGSDTTQKARILVMTSDANKIIHKAITWAKKFGVTSYIIGKNYTVRKPLTEDEEKRYKELTNMPPLLMSEDDKKELEQLKIKAQADLVVELYEAEMRTILNETQLGEEFLILTIQSTNNQIGVVAVVQTPIIQWAGVQGGESTITSP